MEPETNTARRAAEAALISGILRKSQLYPDCSAIVSASDFEWMPYGWVWEAAQSVIANGLTIDQVTIADQLSRDGNLDEWRTHYKTQFVGRAALSDLRGQSANGDLLSYAANVKDYSAKAQILERITLAAKWCLNGRTSADIAKDLTSMIETISIPGKVSSRTATLDAVADEAMTEIVKASEGKQKITRTGYVVVDRLIRGFEAPDLTIIGAYPGHGKTAFLASVTKNIYDNTPSKRVLFLTLEMSRVQIYRRLVSMETGISYDAQMEGKLSDDDWARYNRVFDEMKFRTNVAINDISSITPSAIASEIRRFNPEIVFLDYLQLASSDKRADRRNEEVASVARSLKNLAKQFDIPIVAAAQINRDAAKNDNKRPTLQNLAESTELEKSADNVIFLHRPDEQEMRTQVIVAKRRNGPTGEEPLIYVPSKTRFENMQVTR